ncbi:MAG: CDP-alcohol phosphatidyltransferase family protein, partial [Oscillospiraceae bacterium]|nr:CDP-alcohol phosphatidyltransferase family protein [Oscillospiraceae bacterium]
MNLPNKLTVLRVILVPFFIFFLLTDIVPFSKLFALIVFACASITDALDGHIARSRNLVTTFGKFLDPLADKILVISALVCFIEIG